MNWQKQGLIYSPKDLGGWRANTFMTPTPFLIGPNTIRVFGGFRDEEGVSRIGFVDVNAKDPSDVLKISEKPVLDVGCEGMFDDNGVILGSILADGEEVKMYYVGFQLVKRVKFLAFSGLAISKDDGYTFNRIMDTPIMDRFNRQRYIRAIHSVLKIDGKYKIWFSAGNRWKIINDIPYPQYNIWYTESVDGVIIPYSEGKLCIDTEGEEYRIGRPTVWFDNGVYKMFYTRDTLNKNYSSGYAESMDGINWSRKDELFNLPISSSGWDSEMICYPVPIVTNYGTFLFYSGNKMGLSGVGYAVLQ